MNEPIENSTEAFERALKAEEDASYLLRLFVSGNTPASLRAIVNLRKICEENLKGRYKLEVIDIQQQPELAKSDQIVAVPTLVKELPVPLRKMIGDMSKEDRIFVGLNLRKVK